jgi:hypothetical protein
MHRNQSESNGPTFLPHPLSPWDAARQKNGIESSRLLLYNRMVAALTRDTPDARKTIHQ